ncbi:MAG TPA: hypothetical protein VKY73_03145 [Polyangiaceae bacterium]|nr:hypothetical protein [Polyangiaceae bacterium]
MLFGMALARSLPAHGMKFELRLVEPAAEGVRYAVAVDLPNGTYLGRAELLGDTGEIGFVWEESAPPEWCVTIVRAQLRALFRQRASGYPRRITRWRPAPGEASS